MSTFTELDARRLGRVRRFFAQHPSASDLLVCLLFLADSVLARQVGADNGRTDPLLVVLIGVAGTACLALRRRYPVAVLTAVAVLGVLQALTTGYLDQFTLGIALACYAVAAVCGPRTTWAAAGGATLLCVAALVLWGAPSRPDSGHVTLYTIDGEAVRSSVDSALMSEGPGLALGVLAALTVGANVRGHRHHARTLVARHRQAVQAGEQQAVLAAAAEQTRIAREMHDVVAHGLTVMVALSDGARAALRRSPDDAEHALELLSETGRSALGDMRLMLGVLRGTDAPMEPQPTAQDLDALVQSFRAANLTVRLTTAGPALPEDATLLLTVHRVVQESLTNALRHAGDGTTVTVVVNHLPDRVEVTVVDTGPVDTGAKSTLGGERRLTRLGDLMGGAARRGSSEPDDVDPGVPRPGRGLVGMRERAAVYGGAVSAGPFRNGWRVHVVLRLDRGTATV